MYTISLPLSRQITVISLLVFYLLLITETSEKGCLYIYKREIHSIVGLMYGLSEARRVKFPGIVTGKYVVDAPYISAYCYY